MTAAAAPRMPAGAEGTDQAKSALVEETGAGEGFSVRPMNEADVEPVVRLHQAAFPNSFMTTFGHRFLGAFYAGLIVHPDGYGCVAADGGDRPVGFCVGGCGAVQGMARSMLLRRPHSFLGPTLFNVLRSPRRLGRVLQVAWSYLGRGSQEEAVPSTALLMQIAVDRDLRGSGAAERMVQCFLGEMRLRGVTSVILGVEADNARAMAFYRRMGFQEVRAGVFECSLASGPLPRGDT